MIAPLNGQACVGITAIPFEWTALGPARAYLFQIAADPAFNTIVHQESVETASLIFHGALTADSEYYWRIASSNACGMGPFSGPRSFFTSMTPILLVDDDDNSPDVRGFYSGLLDEIGVGYDVFDVGGGPADGPDLPTLQQYRWVIWFSGDQFGSPAEAGPTPTDEVNLVQFLDQGGHLLLSSQDYFHDVGVVNGFMSQYLGVDAMSDDQGDYTTVTGMNAFASLGVISLTPTVGGEFFDEVAAGAGTLVFQGENGKGAGVKTANTLFLPFTFATFIRENAFQAENLIRTLYTEIGLDGCGNLNGPCVVFDLDGDGFDSGDLGRRLDLWQIEETVLTLSVMVDCL